MKNTTNVLAVALDMTHTICRKMGVKITQTNGPLGIRGSYDFDPLGGLPIAWVDERGTHVVCAVPKPTTKLKPWYKKWLKWITNIWR